MEEANWGEMLSSLYSLTALTKNLKGEIDVMAREDRSKNRRYRLSIETEIIETGEFSTTVHTHSRNLEVFEPDSLEAARVLQGKFIEFARGIQAELRADAQADNGSVTEDASAGANAVNPRPAP